VKITQLHTLFHSKLRTLYPKEEIDTFFHLLAEHALGLTRVDRALQPQFEIPLKKHLFFKKAMEQLEEERPIQYILGKTEFFSLPFELCKDVLIPRPETEELVQWILDTTQDKKNLKILDIGTGSGCSAVALAKNATNAKVTALDFSKKALAIAKENATKNNVALKFLEQDILNTSSLPEKYDIIVSNPPYVRNLEKKEIKKNVLAYEPDSALFVADCNPLIFYDKISELAKKHLKTDGQLFFEINQYLGNEMLFLLKQKGFSNPILRKDIFKNDRMIKASLHCSISKNN
jgi:release factor glutamine methyltransferase